MRSARQLVKTNGAIFSFANNIIIMDSLRSRHTSWSCHKYVKAVSNFLTVFLKEEQLKIFLLTPSSSSVPCEFESPTSLKNTLTFFFSDSG